MIMDAANRLGLVLVPIEIRLEQKSESTWRQATTQAQQAWK
jgi:hypothetical protein